MKSLVCLVLASSVLASPLVSFAQSSAPVTRAQVRDELTRLAQAGYHVGDGDQTTYPAQIQDAEGKVAAQDGQAANNAVGGTSNGTSASGDRLNPRNASQPPCVGPVSFCNLFFGN